MSIETEVLDTYQDLLTAIDCFVHHVSTELPNSAIAMNKDGEFVSDVDSLRVALTHATVEFDIAAQETLAFPGAVGGNQDTIKLAHVINQHKRHFYQSMRSMLAACQSNDTSMIRELLKPRYGALKLKHIYRQLKVLDFCPRRISWSKAANNMNIIVSQAKAFDMLDALGEGQNISIQKKKLSGIRPHEKLVISRQMKPYSAVNVSTIKKTDTPSRTIKFHTSLPVIYLYDEKHQRPLVTHAKPRKNRSNQSRNDKKIEDQVFLPSISAYRYK